MCVHLYLVNTNWKYTRILLQKVVSNSKLFRGSTLILIVHSLINCSVTHQKTANHVIVLLYLDVFVCIKLQIWKRPSEGFVSLVS